MENIEQEDYPLTWSGEATFQQVSELALSVFPGAYIDEDNDGQWVIYTDLKVKEDECANTIRGHYVVSDDDEDFTYNIDDPAYFGRSE